MLGEIALHARFVDQPESRRASAYRSPAADRVATKTSTESEPGSASFVDMLREPGAISVVRGLAHIDVDLVAIMREAREQRAEVPVMITV